MFEVPQDYLELLRACSAIGFIAAPAGNPNTTPPSTAT
jgi:hypothetical protein